MVKAGDDILMAAFGAGLTWGAAHLRWGHRVEPIAKSDAQLPDCHKPALELLEEAIKFCKKHGSNA